jgi:hypothetical protein
MTMSNDTDLKASSRRRTSAGRDALLDVVGPLAPACLPMVIG